MVLFVIKNPPKYDSHRFLLHQQVKYINSQEKIQEIACKVVFIVIK